MSKGRLIDMLVFTGSGDAMLCLKEKRDQKYAARMYSRRLHADGENFYVWVVIVRDSPDRWQDARAPQ